MKSDEELFELAMHDRQYRDYKSCVANNGLSRNWRQAKAKANAPIVVSRPVVEMPKFDVEKIQQTYPNAQPVQSPVRGKVIVAIRR